MKIVVLMLLALFILGVFALRGLGVAAAREKLIGRDDEREDANATRH